MRWLKFTAAGQTSWGIVEGDEVVTVSGDPFGEHNGKETGRFATGDMIFGIVPFIVELTKYFTLWPGDVIWMGTDGASPNIKAGDVVEIEITGIGTLRNKFVAEKR